MQEQAEKHNRMANGLAWAGRNREKQNIDRHGQTETEETKQNKKKHVLTEAKPETERRKQRHMDRRIRQHGTDRYEQTESERQG